MVSLGTRRRGSAAASNFAFTLDFTAGGTDAGPAATPEPASLFLLGTAIAGVFGLRGRSCNRATHGRPRRHPHRPESLEWRTTADP
jgi:hypothetical protein